jgi:hypothetical protein
MIKTGHTAVPNVDRRLVFTIIGRDGGGTWIPAIIRHSLRLKYRGLSARSME